MLPHSDFYKLWQIGAQDKNYQIISPYPNILTASAVNVGIKNSCKFLFNSLLKYISPPSIMLG